MANGSSGGMNGMNGTNTIGGLLAPSNMGGRGSQHNRAVSLPVFTQPQNMPAPMAQQPQHQNNGYSGMSTGLGGYVSGNDVDLARDVARKLRTGAIWVNGGFDFHAPFGGYKRSGNGREWGEYGFHEYLEVKSIIG